MVLQGHTGSISCVKFSPSGRFLATGSADNTAMLWDIDRGIFYRSLCGHTAGISALAWSHDSTRLCTASDDCTLIVWDVESGETLMTLMGHTGFVFTVDFSPVDDTVISGSFDNTVKMWNSNNGKCFRSTNAHSDPVTSVCFNKDGSLYTTASFDGLCRVWDTQSGHCLKTIVQEENVPIACVKFSPNGKYLLISTLDNTLRLWNYAQSKPLKSYRGHKTENYCVNSTFAIHGSQCGILSGSEDGHILLWDLQKKSVLQKLPKQTFPVLAIDSHPNSIMVAAGTLANEDETPSCCIYGPVQKNTRPVLISAPTGF